MRILIQACCGPCVSVATERLLEGGHEVALFFSNANLWPEMEWTRRLEGVKRVGEHFGVEVLEEAWDGAAWRREVGQGMEAEREGGARCERCFAWRLERTWKRAQALVFDGFTTSLTVGPRKRSEVIFEIGRQIGGAHFVAEDFKKRGGFQQSVELARQLGLYRQAYCGCAFSQLTVNKEQLKSFQSSHQPFREGCHE